MNNVVKSQTNLKELSTPKEKKKGESKVVKEKKPNFFTMKSIPNYVFLILVSVIVILTIVVIAVAVQKNGNKKDEEEKGENKGQTQAQSQEEEKEENLTPWQKYIKAEKYLYIWEYYTPDFILRMCKDHHFTRVYLSIGCIATFWDSYYSHGEFPASGEIGSLDYETFIKKLNDINVEVELVTFLDRNPNDFSNMERAVTVAKMVKELSKRVKIKALHFDQETGQNESYENLLKMYIKVNKIFPASAILRPFWLNLKMNTLKKSFKNRKFFRRFSECETLVDAIMKVTKFTDLMAYNENYNTVNTYMSKLKTIAKRHPDNEAKNVIEISGGDGVPAEDTLYQRYMEDKDKLFTFIYDSSKKYGAINIHYFETWYQLLYCVWPRLNIPYEGGQPKEC